MENKRVASNIKYKLLFQDPRTITEAYIQGKCKHTLGR